MSIPPETIEVGRCYLYRAERGPRVLRVLALLPDGRVQYDLRNCYSAGSRKLWKVGILDRARFAQMAEIEVSCDWMPSADEDSR